MTTQLGFDECYDEMISLPLILMCACVSESRSGDWNKETVHSDILVLYS